MTNALFCVQYSKLDGGRDLIFCPLAQKTIIKIHEVPDSSKDFTQSPVNGR
jgi:hypothetical protein